MGLDMGCRCGEIEFRAGSYTQFNCWRELLAELAGIGDLNKFWGTHPITQRTGTEPFFELLNHSDCDGSLPYRECKRLLPDFDRFKKQLMKPKTLKDVWKKVFGVPEVPEWWLEKFDKWHEAIRHAVNSRCTLLFS